ncbi:polysaccharide deacetylase family protein [Nonomuraea sp. NPDC001023]|uniref:polysaccharide deacetylase family protein n=2 Tax=Nonomuraea TaxID=83681 RepID=UPI0033335221
MPFVLIVLVGCAAQPVPRRHSAMIRPQVSPEVLAKRLIAQQADWPRSRRFDCGKIKCVALTFDDGPGPYTGKLLDLLHQRHVRATFFVLGEMVAADSGGRITRRIVDEGHEIGNHSWSHPSLTGLSREGVRNELGHTDELVHRLTGVKMRVMRPPYGSTDDAVAAETRREGLAQILWDVDTLDWLHREPAAVVRRADTAKAGSIVLMHDIHPTTVEAVPKVIDTLARKGYTFVTISELYGRPPTPGRTYTAR